MDIPANNTFTSEPPDWRQPQPADYLYFFIGIPVALAVLFSMVGIRLTAGMPYLDALGYMILHMLLAWAAVSGGAFLAHYLCRSWRPPVIALCVMGFVISLVPAALSFHWLGDLYAAWYPEFAANRSDNIPSWSLGYVSHFVRFSIPAVPLYLAGIYGYRALRQVDWLGYGSPLISVHTEEPPVQEKSRRIATAGLLQGAGLPDNAELIAVKAEQHYIQIWSDQGKELVRYRFRDVARNLSGCEGDQVHRSWWVNYGHVAGVRKAGRSIELVLENKLTVPVSLANRNTVMKALEGKIESD